MEHDQTRFAELLRHYDLVETKLAELQQEKVRLEGQKQNLRALLRDEVTNMGMGPGSVLNVPGVGRFNFTTERYYHLPAEYRGRFVQHLIEVGEVGVLSVTRSALKEWADDKKNTEQPVPSYLTYHEDKFVPRISLESTKARKRHAAAQRAAERRGEEAS